MQETCVYCYGSGCTDLWHPVVFKGLFTLIKNNLKYNIVQHEKTGIQIWNLKGLMTLYQVTLHLNSSISVDHKPPYHTLTSCRLYQSKSKPNNFSDSISLPRACSLHRKWLCSTRTLQEDMLAARCLMLNSYLIDRYFSLHMTTNIGDVKFSNNLVYGRNGLRQRKIQTVERKFFY